MDRVACYGAISLFLIVVLTIPFLFFQNTTLYEFIHLGLSLSGSNAGSGNRPYGGLTWAFFFGSMMTSISKPASADGLSGFSKFLGYYYVRLVVGGRREEGEWWKERLEASMLAPVGLSGLV